MAAGIDVASFHQGREVELDAGAQVLCVGQPHLALVVHLGL